MKKALSLLLSLCMLFTCIACAEGIQAHVTLNVMNENQADVTVKLAQDEDGCYQLYVDGTADGEALNAFLQIGQAALVLGQNGQYMQVDYETLLNALQEALPQVLSEEQMMILGLIAYAFTGLEGDLEIVGDILENEFTRLLNVGMTKGIISYTRDGIVFEADQDQLLDLAKGYVASLAADSAVFGQLSQTQIWSVLGLSEGGVQEQAMVAQFSREFNQVTLPGTFTFYIKAVIGMSGTIDAVIDLKVPKEEIDLSLTAKLEGEALNIALTGSVEEVNIDVTFDVTQTYDGLKLDAYANLTDGRTTVTANDQTVLAGTSISGSANVNAVVPNEGVNVKGESAYNFDFESFSGAADLSIVVDLGEKGTGYINGEFSLDKVNGLYIGFEVTDPDGVTNAAYIKGNAQANEYGFVANLSVDVVADNTALDDMINIDLVVSDVITLHAHVKDYVWMDDEPYYSEYWNEYDVYVNSLFGGSDYRWMSLEEYETFKTTFEEGLQEVFSLDAVIDTYTYGVNVSVNADGQNLSLVGAVVGSEYILTATANGQTVFAANLEVIDNDALSSILLGKLTVTVPSENLVVERTTELSANGGAWVFNVYEYGELTNNFKVGYRDLSAGDRYNYEVYMSNQGMEYTLGVVFEQQSERVFAEAYVNMASGMYKVSYFDLKLELTPIYTAFPHVTGQSIPQEQLEYILVDILEEAVDAIEDLF